MELRCCERISSQLEALVCVGGKIQKTLEHSLITSANVKHEREDAKFFQRSPNFVRLDSWVRLLFKLRG